MKVLIDLHLKKKRYVGLKKGIKYIDYKTPIFLSE